jgi:hypothetical protein
MLENTALIEVISHDRLWFSCGVCKWCYTVGDKLRSEDIQCDVCDTVFHFERFVETELTYNGVSVTVGILPLVVGFPISEFAPREFDHEGGF